MTPFAALLVGVVALGSCSPLACESTLTVRFDSSRLEVGTTYGLRICIDNGCIWDRKELVDPGDLFEVTVPLGDLAEGSEAHVTVDLRQGTNLVERIHRQRDVRR